MDKWEFYKDAQGQWRWRRTSPNGRIVGAACQGYTNIGIPPFFLREIDP